MTMSNMRTTVVVAAVTLLIACGVAQASEWVSLGKTDDGKTEYFVDVSGIQPSVGVITRAWVKLVFARHTQRFPAEDSKKKWAVYSVQRFAYMCAEGNAEVEAMSVYFEDGTHFAVPADAITMVGGTSEPVPPDTIGDTVMKFVCNWKPPTQIGDPPSQNGDPHLSDVDRSTPAQGVETIRMPDCRKDYYPSQALRLKQEGSVVVKVCIGVDNKIDGPVEVLTSSGFPALDEAAGKCVGAGRYRAGNINGAPAATCKKILVTFTLLEGR